MAGTGEVPPPPKGVDDKPDWADDPKAEAEEAKWDKEGELKGVHLSNSILWARVYGFIVAGMMIFFTMAFCASLGIWLWHFLSPWPWLKPEQLSKIQSIIFSGSLGAIVTAYAQKHMNRLGL